MIKGFPKVGTGQWKGLFPFVGLQSVHLQYSTVKKFFWSCNYFIHRITKPEEARKKSFFSTVTSNTSNTFLKRYLGAIRPTVPLKNKKPCPTQPGKHIGQGIENSNF